MRVCLCRVCSCERCACLGCVCVSMPMWDSSCESWVLVHERVKSHTATLLSHLTLLTSLWTDVVMVLSCSLVPLQAAV